MKKSYIQKIILLMLIGSLGCSSKMESQTEKYLRCNDTSLGKMAEIKDGYFFAMEEFLFYADKDNLNQWVKVCNKPDCEHMDSTCNAYLPSYNTIIQKDGKLYEICAGDNFYDKPYIFEIATDGSGIKRAYEIPIGDGINPTGYGNATFQDRVLFQYGYLDEDGIYQEHLIRLEEDEKEEVKLHTLYEGTDGSLILSGNQYWNIRGDDVIVTSLLLGEGKDALSNLCKIDGEVLEPLNLPEDISFARGYLSGDLLTYYKEKEGFYEYNINTGERKLICANQLEDGRGYILSEDYMIESNRYIGYMPEEAFLKFYNGEQWLDLEVPEEVATTDNPFYPLCIASDRIFFCHGIKEDGSSSVNETCLYYMMINDDTPELVFAGKIQKNDESEESRSEETEQESSSITNVGKDFEEKVVFDIEEYFFKITNVYLDDSNRYCIDMEFENKGDNEYYVWGNYCAINGIQCNTQWGDTIASQEKKLLTLCFYEDVLEVSKILDIYDYEEYADIAIGFQVAECSKMEFVKETVVHIYPNGEENATTFIRESQTTDNVLIDNENVSVIVTGYETEFIPNDTINVLITNKTEQYMRVKVEEASANGIVLEADKYWGVYNIIINPGATAMYPMTLFNDVIEGISNIEPKDTFFVENSISSIEEIHMKLRISAYDYIEGVNGEDFVYKTFVLNP